MICTHHYWDDDIKAGRLACRRVRVKKFEGQREGRRLFERPQNRRNDNNKVEIKEIV